MQCPRCRTENPPQAKFCLECAHPVGTVAPAPPGSLRLVPRDGHGLLADAGRGGAATARRGPSGADPGLTPGAGEEMRVPETFTLSGVLEQRRQAGKSWLEFLRVSALSMGVYVLPAGAEDPQGPHTEDEVYYVLAGRATLRVEGEDRPAAPGSLLYVGAGVRHRFHGITEDLTALVFFAPAEGTAPPAGVH